MPDNPGRRPSRALAMALIGVAALAALAVVLLSQPHSPRDGDPARLTSTDPAGFVLPRLVGPGNVRLADFRGRPTVVNFFASWCTACRGEAPGFVHTNADLHGSVAFVGVNSLETGDSKAFARELGYDQLTLARDSGGQQGSGLHDALGRPGLPVTAFYSSTGRLVYVATGALPEDVLRSRISDLFGVR